MRGQKPAGDRAWMVWGVLLLLTAAGALLRFWRLGELGLIVDEGYQANAVRGILRYGIPTLESGQVYSRSPFFLYFQAGWCWLLGMSAFSLRLPAALFGVALIPLSYWFGRSLLDRRVGLVLAALVAFSSWEVEYARYARFYTLLQVCYLVALVAWYRWYIEGRKGWFWAFAASFFLAIVTHDLGVMICASFIMILPLRGYSVRRRVGAVGWSFACGITYLLWNAGLNKVTHLLSAQIDDAQKIATSRTVGGLPTFKWPDMRILETAWADHRLTMVAGAVVLALISVALVVVTLRSSRLAVTTDRVHDTAGLRGLAIRDTGGWVAVRVAVVVAIAWTGGFHTLALAMVLFVGYLALFVREHRQLFRLEFVLACVTAGVGFAAWVAWLKFTSKFSLTEGLREMLRFPAMWDYFFRWTIYGWTAMLGLWGIAFIVMAGRAATPDRRCNAYWALVALVILPLVGTSQLAWKFTESRYFLHLYPLLLAWIAVLVVAAADRVCGSGKREVRSAKSEDVTPQFRNGLIVAALTVVVLFTTHDANPLVAWEVSRRTHMDPRDPIRSVVNFPWHAVRHLDLQSPAQWVAPQLEDGDVVMVLGPTYQAGVYAYYLDNRVDYMVTSTERTPVASAGLAPGERPAFRSHPKSGTYLVVWPADLKWVLRDARDHGRSVWFFGDRTMLNPRNWFFRSLHPPMEDVVHRVMGASEPVFVGRDEIITVQLFADGRMPPDIQKMLDESDAPVDAPGKDEPTEPASDSGMFAE